MKTILTFLSGKKSVIASLIGLIVSYLATKTILGEAEVLLIMGITTLIFGTASYATGKIVYKN